MKETKQQLRDKIKELERQLAIYKANAEYQQKWYESYSRQRAEMFKQSSIYDD